MCWLYSGRRRRLNLVRMEAALSAILDLSSLFSISVVYGATMGKRET
jgi:hypothetical protein